VLFFGEEQHDFTIVNVVIKLQFDYRYIKVGCRHSVGALPVPNWSGTKLARSASISSSGTCGLLRGPLFLVRFRTEAKFLAH
jgi:hypothetical protein